MVFCLMHSFAEFGFAWCCFDQLCIVMFALVRLFRIVIPTYTTALLLCFVCCFVISFCFASPPPSKKNDYRSHTVFKYHDIFLCAWQSLNQETYKQHPTMMIARSTLHPGAPPDCAQGGPGIK
jgi:hypothetical protein